MINQQIIDKAPDIRQAFQSALPFRHVQIDNFLDPEICEGLLRDFPSFDRDKAKNELGHVGGKAVTENVSSISPLYAKFYEYINSKPFLQTISDLTRHIGCTIDAHTFCELALSIGTIAGS